MDLLSTFAKTDHELDLTFLITSPQFPLSLYLLSESRDKHGIRPSIHKVIEEGMVFEIVKNGTSAIHVAFATTTKA